jgi:hypothetical protein
MIYTPGSKGASWARAFNERIFSGGPFVFISTVHEQFPLTEIPGGADLVAVFAAIGTLFGVFQVKDVGDIGLGRGDTPGIFTDQDVFHPFRKLEFDLPGDFFIFDDIHRNIGIDKAEDIQIYGDGVVDLDDVLAAHVFGAGVYHKGHRIGGLTEAEPVEDPEPQTRFNMIDDDPVFYFGDI